MKRILINLHETHSPCLYMDYMDAKYRFLDLKQDKINTPARKKNGQRTGTGISQKRYCKWQLTYEVTQDLISNQRGVD